MEGLCAPTIGDDKIATIFCVDVSSMKWNSTATSMSHFCLIAVIWQQSIGQHKPPFLVTFNIIGPFVKPTFGLWRLLLLVSSTSTARHIIARDYRSRGWGCGWIWSWSGTGWQRQSFGVHVLSGRHGAVRTQQRGRGGSRSCMFFPWQSEAVLSKPDWKVTSQVQIANAAVEALTADCSGADGLCWLEAKIDISLITTQDFSWQSWLTAICLRFFAVEVSRATQHWTESTAVHSVVQSCQLTFCFAVFSTKFGSDLFFKWCL